MAWWSNLQDRPSAAKTSGHALDDVTIPEDTGTDESVNVLRQTARRDRREVTQCDHLRNDQLVQRLLEISEWAALRVLGTYQPLHRRLDICVRVRIRG